MLGRDQRKIIFQAAKITLFQNIGFKEFSEVVNVREV